jgi:tetratricopeptide (TPR) repeat protein
LALNPTDPLTLMQSAQAYVGLRQFQAAQRGLALAEKIAETDADRARVFALKGMAFEAEGRLHEALGAYSAALGLDPNNYDAQQGIDRLSPRG